MPDLTLLTAWLQAQGQWGALIVILLPVIGWYVKYRMSPVAPLAAGGSPTPTLDAILKAFGIQPKNRAATSTDVPHDFHLALQAMLDKVAADKAAIAQAVVKDYQDLALIEVEKAEKK